MNKGLRTLLQYVIFFGLGALLISWQYNKLTPEERTEIFQAFQAIEGRLWLLIPVILIGFLSHFFRALRWKLLLDPLEIRPSVTNMTFAVLVGYLVNLLIPRMGEVARCSVLAKYERKPLDKIVGTIVGERAFDVVCLVFITIATFLLQIDIAENYVHKQLQHMHISETSIILLLVSIILLFTLLLFFYRKNKKTVLGKFLKGMGQGIMSILRLQKKGLFFFYTFAIWFCYLSLVYIGFLCIDATTHLGWMPALSVLVFGSLGMIVTPGGIGAYPPAVQLVLVELYQIKSSYALAFGWVSWIAQTLIIIILGALSLLLLPVYNANKHGKTTVDSE